MDVPVEKKKKKRKWPWIIGLIILGIGLYGWNVYANLSSNLKSVHVEINRDKSDLRVEKVNLEKKEPFSILLLGVDQRENDKGRSDTIIVLTINANEGSTKMLSIPRDTYTKIIGYGTSDKLNHAYAFGGTKMAMASVENLLDIPIDYVTEVNMEGFQDIVDAVGGITVHNMLAFKEESYSFPKGEIKLDGEHALAYVRMRKEDPDGDFGRQERQKQLIQGILKEGASVSSLWKYKDIFNALGDNISTNLTFGQMMELQKNHKEAINSIEQLYFNKGQGQTMHGIWYYMMNKKELKDVSAELKTHLGLK
ncbi:LytR family transcriptional regulator [Viridibacillus sp. FSL H7-0596]|uniref:LCP family glycopolymer transferase n=1 Tax=Viridibacillus sp. FSL H7-0596 TaxID=1928923 RepID=UPI00096E0E02|nr:LCP family protein [Viridibacillus sp. FSL H7-0596]OMC89176.1 LytR family transcriptional regulator [Viridibacillus sp. FSL H7-0596]